MSPPQIPPVHVFSGWKQIAKYLGKGVRSVQRYERELGLPVRRPAGRSTGSVFATQAELDAWLTAAPIRDALPLRMPHDNNAALKQLRLHIREANRLRLESVSLRTSLLDSLELLRATVQHILPAARRVFENSPMLDDWERGLLGEVLSFDLKKKAN